MKIKTPQRRGHLGRRFATIVALAASALTIGMAGTASAKYDPSCPVEFPDTCYMK